MAVVKLREREPNQIKVEIVEVSGSAGRAGSVSDGFQQTSLTLPLVPLFEGTPSLTLRARGINVKRWCAGVYSIIHTEY